MPILGRRTHFNYIFSPESRSFVKLAMIHLMLNRLRPKDTDAEFHYRQAA
jgi:hypothetical protein